MSMYTDGVTVIEDRSAAARFSAEAENDRLTALKALADPSRLKIVEFLLEPEGDCCSRQDGVCGCDFEALLDLSQPTVSHHLKILVQAGLLRASKRGRWTYYELRRGPFDELAAFLSHFGGRSGERKRGNV